MKSGTLRTLSMRGDELDLVVNYLANRYRRRQFPHRAAAGVLTLAASVEVPASPFGRYLNVQATLRETAGLPAFDQLRIGRLPVPGWVGDWALARALRTLDGTAEHQVAADTIRSVSIADGACGWSTSGATICPRDWATDAAAGGPRAPQDLPGASGEFTRDAATPRSVSLADLLTPLLRLASERGASGDAQAESRAVMPSSRSTSTARGSRRSSPARRTGRARRRAR